MASGRAALLLLLVIFLLAQVESPSLGYSCGDGEYYHSGICCKNCPAGTHVGEHCNTPHTLEYCVACTEGEDYTAHDNGLDACLRCNECKSGTTMVKPCTVKSNAECRCNDGYYCPPNCEECLKCKTKCPEGQVTVQNCNATGDMECGPSPTGASHFDYMLILYIALCAAAVFIIVIGIGIFCKKYHSPRRKEEKSANKYLYAYSTDDLLPSRKNSNTDAIPEAHPPLADPAAVSSYSVLPGNINSPLSHTKEASSSAAVPLLQSTDNPVSYNVQPNVQPSNTECSAGTKPSYDELSEICDELTDKVPIRYWTKLMRNAGLSDNEIDSITYDYPSDIREQQHRMVKILCDKLGPENALCKLLNGLQQMKLTHIYENLRNELLTKNKIIVDKGRCHYFVKNAEEQNL